MGSLIFDFRYLLISVILNHISFITKKPHDRTKAIRIASHCKSNSSPNGDATLQIGSIASYLSL